MSWPRHAPPKPSTCCRAHAGIPYYLLVDRDPKIGNTTLYVDPDRRSGTYTALRTWAFGEPIRLPQPFGFDILTDRWEPWDA